MASAPAPRAAPEFPVWSCSNSDLEQPLTMKLWPPFAAGKAAKFGTAMWMVILTVVVLTVMGFVLAKSKSEKVSDLSGSLTTTTTTSPKWRQPSTLKGILAMLLVMLAGISATWGFALWGLKYTHPDMERDPPPDGYEPPGLLDSGKVPKDIKPPVCEAYDGFLMSPLMYIVIVPAVGVMLGVFLMIKRYGTKEVKESTAA